MIYIQDAGAAGMLLHIKGLTARALYTSLDNIIGKLFKKVKTITRLLHSLAFQT